MLLSSAIALLVAQLLPGLFLVKLARAGRTREERLVLAAVAGGPVAALVYLVTALFLDAPWLYWTSTIALGAGGVFLRAPVKLRGSWPRGSSWALFGIVAAVLVPYLLTTGSLYRVDESGALLLDRALQRDALFHIGVTRSLESAYPPALLSVSGTPIGYHVGYHLKLAALSRFFGIDPIDGLIRVGTCWEIALLVFSAYLLARRFTASERARLLAAALVFGAGFGFLAFSRPSVDWWSLAFMDVTLVSVFLANPFLPAMPLLFAGLALVGDYLDEGDRGALGLGVFLLAFLFVVKVFAGAQVLAALGMASVTRVRDRRVRSAFAALAVASVPLLAHTFLAASGSNTSVTLRPFEIVRYSMEKLGWERAVEALAETGQLDVPAEGLVFVAAVLLVWLVGFAGLRVVALPDGAADLFGSGALRRTMAWFCAIGLAAALLFRIAPGESEGLSRLEAQNDIVWFAAQSGILLWFWTALVLSRFRATFAILAVGLLALPGTAQHFVHASRLPPDRLGPTRMRAALEARAGSPPGAIWLETLDRARPSLLPYIAGRAVVYDPYVGYDYMFVGREEIDYRRHAVAHFWASSDPAYAAWMLDRFGVGYVWEEGRVVPPSALLFLENVYDNEDVALHRVRENDLAAGLELKLSAPGSIPLGGGGHAFFGDGWSWTEGEAFRDLLPGEATLYLPRERGRELSLTLELVTPHAAGVLAVASERANLGETDSRVTVRLAPSDERGLLAIPVRWSGASPLRVSALAATPADP